jgi:hypothetical protein
LGAWHFAAYPRLGNFVKYRFDAKIAEDRLALLEYAKNEKLMAEYIGEK